MGDYVKVSAIDPASLKEVSIIGSPKLTKAQLSEMAVKKLLYVMGKSKEKPEESEESDLI